MRWKCCFLLATLAVLVAVPALAQPIEDAFWVIVSPYPPELFEGGGSGYGEGTWYFYENTDWWNEWFYDHPFDLERSKEVHITYDVRLMDPGLGGFLVFALNWSTQWWSEVGNPAGEDRLPPLPPMSPEDEELAIVRHILFQDDTITPEIQHFDFSFIIEDYNPEWVSIDVWGWNFEITGGYISHECLPPTAVDESTWGGIKALYRE